MNIQQTNGRSVTIALPEDIRRNLIALRNKHGAKSAIGSRCSNIFELLKAPELPTAHLRRQMADLERLLAGLQ